MIYLRLFIEFFKTGLFAVGGWLAILPFIEEMADKTGWFTREELINMVAVSESTPGSIGVNMATYVGYTTAGFGGAAVATVGLVLPSLLSILLVAMVLNSFRKDRRVQGVFYGMRPASVGLIAASAVSVVTVAVLRTELFAETGKLTDAVNWKGLALAAVLLYFTRFCKKTSKWHPIVFVAISAAVGILFRFGA